MWGQVSDPQDPFGPEPSTPPARLNEPTAGRTPPTPAAIPNGGQGRGEVAPPCFS